MERNRRAKHQGCKSRYIHSHQSSVGLPSLLKFPRHKAHYFVKEEASSSKVGTLEPETGEGVTSLHAFSGRFRLASWTLCTFLPDDIRKLHCALPTPLTPSGVSRFELRRNLFIPIGFSNRPHPEALEDHRTQTLTDAAKS